MRVTNGHGKSNAATIGIIHRKVISPTKKVVCCCCFDIIIIIVPFLFASYCEFVFAWVVEVKLVHSQVLKILRGLISKGRRFLYSIYIMNEYTVCHSSWSVKSHLNFYLNFLKKFYPLLFTKLTRDDFIRGFALWMWY
jgi:hypothetical protein